MFFSAVKIKTKTVYKYFYDSHNFNTINIKKYLAA